MGFAQAAADANDKVFSAFGMSALFIPRAENPVSCTVIVKKESDFSPEGYQSMTHEARITIKYKLSDIDRDINAGEYFIIDGTSIPYLKDGSNDYFFDGMESTDNPAYTRKMAAVERG